MGAYVHFGMDNFSKRLEGEDLDWSAKLELDVSTMYETYMQDLLKA
jgi:hypothetical protein